MPFSRRSFVKTAALGTLAAALPMGRGQANLFSGTPSTRFLDAICKGDLETVRSLLRVDPELLHQTDSAGRSGYALALLNGQLAVARYLQEQGYQSDLHEAALALDWERYSRLAEEDGQGVNADHPIGGTAMYAAAAGGAGTHLWRVYATAGDPDLNPRSHSGMTPLQAALLFRDLETAELTAATLIVNNADPDPPGNAEDPPLHLAAARGSVEIVELLIQFGADPDRRDSLGRTAAMHAHRSGHRRVVAQLTRTDKIPRLNNSHRTAFNVRGEIYQEPMLDAFPALERERIVAAAHTAYDEIVSATARNHALAHVVSTTGERAVEAGAHMGRRDIVDHLLEKGAPYSLPTAVMRGDEVTVRSWLDLHPDRIYERGAHGFPLLWYPIIGGTGLDMMHLLLTRGCEVEQQHFLGTTALHWACRGDSVDMVALLLEQGADPNRTGRKFGGRPMSPLQTAMDAKKDEIADLLRDRGAR